MKVLAIGAHADDVELGCGGALLRHVRQGDEVHILVITESSYRELSGRERLGTDAESESAQTAARIGATLHHEAFPTLQLTPNADLIFRIQSYVHQIAPDRVYTHYDRDNHLDHAAVGVACRIAVGSVPQILFYRSNLHPTSEAFHANFFVDISAYIEEKMALIDLFHSEGPKLERWKKMFRALAQTDGLANRMDYAEGFMLFRYWELDQ